MACEILRRIEMLKSKLKNSQKIRKLPHRDHNLFREKTHKKRILCELEVDPSNGL